MLDFPRLEPPISCKLAENNLDEAIMSGNMPDLEKYTCHTEAIERLLKLLQIPQRQFVTKNVEKATFEQSFNHAKNMSKYTKKVNGNHNLSVTYFEVVM